MSAGEDQFRQPHVLVESHGRDPLAAERPRPYFLMISSGAMTLPRDFDIALPSPSSVQPLVAHSRYGAVPRRPTPTSSEEWNQAAVLIAALQVHLRRPAQVILRSQHSQMAGAGVEPDVQNVTFLPELPVAALGAPSHRGPTVSAAVRSYQTSAVCSLIWATTRSRGARSVRHSLHFSQ